MEPLVRLIPLGGLGEIGLNMMLVESGDELIAVDCGLMFPDDELPGIDYVIPDFSYALAKPKVLRAVFLTHGHEDHIGALPYLLKRTRVPVYGSPLTMALLAEKLREHDLPDVELIAVRPRERVEIGPFTIEPLRVTHSIADGVGLAITTPVGLIVHTGDFKLDPEPLDGELPDYDAFRGLGDRGVTVLCSDSTNVDRPGHTRSESDVGVALAERFAGARGRIIVATFASHIHRIQAVLRLAARFGRKAALLGRSMERNVRVAADMGYLTLPEGVVVTLEELAGMAPEHQVILSTGSQGEPNSALSLMAAGEHKYFSVGAGDLVILSSRVIPGNERTVSRIINGLYRRGADVLYEDNAFVHVSGHASQEDLKLMLQLTRPKYFLPVHGEYRHLRSHARLAVGEGVAVAITIDRDGAVVAGPSIASRGVVYVKENEALIEELRAAVAQAVAAMERVERRDREALSARLRLTVRQFVNQRFQRKPVVLPMILEA